MMFKVFYGGCFVVFLGISITAQPLTARHPAIKSVELFSPWAPAGARMVSDPQLRPKSCFDLILLEQRCGGPQGLGYGNRFGVNWDILTVSGRRESRTRMIHLGEHDWADRFSIPAVEPWSELRPGETRAVTVNTSGADGQNGSRGADGKPGMNGDGTYDPVPVSKGLEPLRNSSRREGFAEKSVDRQVSSTITMNGKTVRGDRYTPFNEAKKGHMYLARVVDSSRDYYVLIRVDELIRGKKVTLSFWKFEMPVVKQIF